MIGKKISELAVATELPGDGELVLPIVEVPVPGDGFFRALRQISLEDLAARIKEAVLSGQEIEVVPTEHGGFKFRRITGEVEDKIVGMEIHEQIGITPHSFADDETLEAYRKMGDNRVGFAEECDHPNIQCSRDGEFNKEECPDCGYSREWEDD